MSSFCTAQVKSKPNSKTLRNCQNKGILDNGMCHVHSKTHIIPSLISKLKTLEKEIENLDTNTNVENLKTQIKITTRHLKELKTFCSKNIDCSRQLTKLKIRLKQVTEPYGIRLRKNQSSYESLKLLDTVGDDIDHISLNSVGDSSLATKITKDHAVATYQGIKNKEHISKLTSQINSITKQSQVQDSNFQKNLEMTGQQLRELDKLKQNTNNEKEKLQTQLEKCRANSMMLSGNYSQMVSKKENEIAHFKSKFDTMVGREMSTNKSLEVLEKTEKQLVNSIEKLKLKHANDLSTLQNMYAQKLKNGETILSEREEELHEQMASLKANLDEAIKQLEISKINGQDALDGLTMAQHPNKEAHIRLLESQKAVQIANRQLHNKENELDELNIQLSKINVHNEARFSIVRTEWEEKLAKVRHDLIMSEQRAIQSAKDLNNNRTEFSQYQTNVQTNISILQQNFIEAKKNLSQVTNELAGTRRILENFKKQSESSRREFQLQYDMKTKQMQARINADNMRIKHQMEIELQEKGAEIVAIRHAQKGESARITERKDRLAREQDNLEKMRNQHFENLSEFEKQKQDYSVNIQRLEQQSTQIDSMQKNHKRRMMMMNQSLQTDRKQYETQILNLKEKIGKLLQAQNNINANLTKCSAVRDGIIERVQSLENDNNKLQNINVQLQSRYDLMKVRFDEHVHNLEKDVSKFQGLLAKCDTNLQETSLVHDHILKEKDQVIRWRKEAQALSNQFKESEEANKKILMEREFANQQKFQLETNLKHIFKEKEILDGKLKGATDTIREYKKMGTDLRSEMKRISQVYQTELRNRDTELLKTKNVAIEKERYLMQKINDVKNNAMRMQKKMVNLKERNELTENAYVDNLTSSATQINNLINAERLMFGRAQNDDLKLSLNTGKSDLVNGI